MDDEQAKRVDEARGGYIGPVDRDEALDAIRGHTSGPVLIDYPERGFAGGEVRRTSGWQNEVGGEGSGTFAFVPDTGHHDHPLGSAIAYSNVFVLDLSVVGDELLTWTAERYTDGVDLTFPAGAVVRLVFWHAAYHVIEGDDVVPGIGPFEGEVDEAGDR